MCVVRLFSLSAHACSKTIVENLPNQKDFDTIALHFTISAIFEEKIFVGNTVILCRGGGVQGKYVEG